MKKILTLLFFVGSVSASFAQTGARQKDDNRNDQYVKAPSNGGYNKFDTHHDNIYAFSASVMNQQIDKIIYDFNLKIKSIEFNRRLSNRDKVALIQRIQVENARQIQLVYAKYNNKYNVAFSDQARKFDNYKH
jgi:hypothetical protein